MVAIAGYFLDPHQLARRQPRRDDLLFPVRSRRFHFSLRSVATAPTLLPAQALLAQATIGGILLVAVVGGFLPVPMAFDVAIAYIAMTKGDPLPYVVTILCTLGMISVLSLSVVG
jgi:hypothetical protein